MQTDTIIQTLFKSFQNIGWKDCEEDSTLEWYYAENNHYVVHHKDMNGYWFVVAKSPSKACNSVISRLKK